MEVITQTIFKKGVSLVNHILLHICKNFIGEVTDFFNEGQIRSLEEMVLDRYHLNRAIVAATGNQPEHRKEIYSSILQGNREQFKAIIKQMNHKAAMSKEKNRIAELRKYVLNNWAAIEIYSEEACSGSCSEGHMSHVLSSRLSSRPMSWSRRGLQVMSRLRAYCSSGGQVKSEHLKKTESPYK